MSKTYRRKKVSDNAILRDICYAYRDIEAIRNCRYNDCSRNCPYRDDAATISRYHRDTRSGYGWNGNAPKSYRKMLNREKRAKAKAEVKRIINQGDYESYSFDKWCHDAGWYYW